MLQETNHTVVWLRPEPVVAKVGKDLANLGREHELATALVAVGAPVAVPVSGTAPTTHAPTALVVTLWELVEGALGLENTPPEPIGESLARLHRALGSLRLDLPSFEDDLWRSRRILDDDAAMEALPGPDRSFVRDVFDDAIGQLRELEVGSQALHGEPHAGNRLVTETGVVWLDLENVCRGPLEWDLAFQPAGVEAMFDRDPSLVTLLKKLNSTRVAAWCFKEARYPVMRRHAEIHLAALRQSVAH